VPSGTKPPLPYPGFPLWPHPIGLWAKKIKGRVYYFGPWEKWQAALDKYVAERDDLFAGRDRRVVGIGVRKLCNLFLGSKQLLVRSGEMSPRTWRDYDATVVRLVRAFGDRPVAGLGGSDFERFRAELAKTRGPVSLGNEVQRVRTIFKYALDERLIDQPVHFGTSFRKPAQAAVRKARQANGPRLFQAADCRKLVDGASQPLKAMVLLALNAGFGQSDLAALPLTALDLDGGWVTFPRPKTGLSRRAKLWPETVAAVREAIAVRPEPAAPEFAALVFLTRPGRRGPGGRPWVRVRDRGNRPATPIDAIAPEFSKLCERLGIQGPAFYGLRHVYRTVADSAGDERAVNFTMGHADRHISTAYVLRIDDARLEAVAAHVRAWIGFGRRQ
jgi:integrase